MTISDMIKMTGELPNRGTTENGIAFELEVSKNELGYIACLWETKGAGYKDHIIAYGTGHSPDKAKESLKKKLLK